MRNFRARVDEQFERICLVFFSHPVKTLLLLGIVVIGLCSQVPKFRADFSDEGFFHSGDQTLRTYKAFQKEFGDENTIVVALNPQEVFDPGFLKQLKTLHENLEAEVPYLDEITSLVNVRFTYGREDELVVEDLLETMPDTQQEMAVLREKVLSSHLYPNMLISEDGQFTIILLRLVPYSEQNLEEAESDAEQGFSDSLSGEDEPELPELTQAEVQRAIDAIRTVTSRFERSDFPIYLVGGEVIGEFFENNILEEQAFFMGMAFVAFFLLLFFLFRRISGVFLPLLVVFLGLGCTIGLMGYFGAPFSHPTSVLPMFLLAVGIGDSVHILALFYTRLREVKVKKNAIVFAIGHSGLPVLMTSLTTAAGMFSFSFADMVPVSNLGIFGGVGVMIEFALTLVLLPAAISLLPIRPGTRITGESYGAFFNKVLSGIARFSVVRAWVIIAVSLGILMVAAVGLTKLRFAHSIRDWLPRKSTLLATVNMIDEKLQGTPTLEVLIDIGAENGLHSPDVLKHIDSISRFAEGYRTAEGKALLGKSNSIVNVVKETNQALHQNKDEYYAIPDDRRLIAQELLLFENSGSDDLESFVDTLFSKARLSLKVRYADATAYVRFVEAIEGEATRLFGDTARITVTGGTRIFAKMMYYIMVNMAESYITAGIIISLLMILFLSSIRLGLLSIIPNIAPVFVTMGVMGWMDIALDMSNMLLGTIAIGLVVDDTIHFLHNFRRYYRISGNINEAVQQTMLTTGRALVFTTVTLVTGFGLFLFSAFPPLSTMGLALCSTLLTALLADILLVPAIMTVGKNFGRLGQDVSHDSSR